MKFPEYLLEISLKSPLQTDSYLSRLPVVRHLMKSPVNFRKPLTVFAGENGAGKSTLIEAIAVAYGFNPEGGTLNFSFETRSTHSELWRYIRLSKLHRPRDGYFLRAESFYNAASYIDELDEITCGAPKIISSYGGVSLHKMSHGEAFLKLIEARLGSGGLYIFDEPEAALSPNGQLRLICELMRLLDSGSQIIMATHSPLLMAIPESEVLYISINGIESVDYRDTEHFTVMSAFYSNPDRMIARLRGK